VQGPQDPREGLETVVALRRLLEALEAAQIENAILAGWSWAQIAEVLGVSKQAVHKKHAKRLREKYPGKEAVRSGRLPPSHTCDSGAGTRRPS
jgi:DNA-directed RNA polymerase specialized sigma24 family protein